MPATITIGRTLDKSTDSVETAELNKLIPFEFDYIDLGYTGSLLTTVVYKAGGAGGTTVATLTLSYSGGLLDTVTRT